MKVVNSLGEYNKVVNSLGEYNTMQATSLANTYTVAAISEQFHFLSMFLGRNTLKVHKIYVSFGEQCWKQTFVDMWTACFCSFAQAWDSPNVWEFKRFSIEEDVEKPFRLAFFQKDFCCCT